MMLLPHHQRLLDESAISSEVAADRGYWSATKPGELNGRFTGVQRRVPGLVIPVRDVFGNEAFCQLRPDEPREKKGKPLKYETPANARMVLDVPPSTLPHIGNPKVTFWITEGIRKADALVSAGLRSIALLGVWNWRGKNEYGGKTALVDWHEIALNGRKIVLCFDSDAFQNHDVHKAVEELGRWLERRNAEPKFVYLPSDGAKVGVDDYLAAGNGKDDLVALIEDRWRPLPSEAAVSKPRQIGTVPQVDGDELLADIQRFIARYMVLPFTRATEKEPEMHHVADLLALWVLHTWTFEAAFATPYLRITSATADSGKTLLLEILAALCRNGWHAVYPSTAVLYRKIDQQQPTLLLDEMDNYPIEERRDALSVLNAGYKRGATIDRCKDTGELEEFKCYCPKAYAGLDQRSLVATLLSRSITIRLERKTAAEQVEMWIAPLAEPLAEPLRDRCAGWAHHNIDALRDARPDLPQGLVNRSAEVWWALLATADRVGGPWPERARKAARVLATGGDSTDDPPDQVRLLLDIRAAFEGNQVIFTKDLLTRLNADEEGPWKARRDGKGLDPRGLSRILRPFKIKPRSVRASGVEGTAKGYQADQFSDAFARHLPNHPPEAAQAAQAAPSNAHRVGDVPDVPDVPGRPGGLGPDEGHAEPEQTEFDIDRDEPPPPFQEDGSDGEQPCEPDEESSALVQRARARYTEAGR